MGLTLAKCPACGANLNLETDNDFFYCPYCGSKVAKQADKIVIETVTRHVEEHVTRTESSRDAVRMKRVEMFDRIFNPSPEVIEQRAKKAEERRKQQELDNAMVMMPTGLVSAVLGLVGVLNNSSSRMAQEAFRVIGWMLLALGIGVAFAGFLIYNSHKNKK